MGAVALQRVVVRMLYDPTFARRVHDGAAPEADVTDEEASWLRAVDLRAFGVDPYRRSRSLTGLIEEFPVTSAHVVRSHGGVPQLDAFFGSDGFHAGMQAGASLAALYGEYLAGLDASLAGVAGLESAIAATRRPQPGPASKWRLAPGVTLVSPPQGTLAHQTVVGQRLGADGALVERVLEESPLPDPPTPPTREPLLVTPGPEGSANVEELTPELHTILRAAAEGCDRAHLDAACRDAGATPAETTQILQGFVASGELLPPETR